MGKLRAAVIGVGYLGRFHAQKFAALEDVDLVAVVDIAPGRAAEVAAEVGTQPYSDYRELLGRLDLVSVVVPTQDHFHVARDCFEADCHVLLEKPITPTIDEAQQLIQLARQRQRVFQVGHLERFNPAVLALQGIVKDPRFIESHRLAPFKPRGTDVNVVLDLMIHDIDIILSIVGSSVSRVNSIGVPVLSDEVDIANARLQFENGCVANVTASRVSREAMRKIRIFQPDAYISIDCQERKFSLYRKGLGERMVPGLPNISMAEKSFSQSDALMAEIRSFVDAVRNGTRPLVPGEDGLRALELALQINTRL